ncbi:hypothetical protein HNR46_001347 [Haloferula luteola]|uniref:Uncharacterized protein n=1 Tax=Haloferula luteola TaxID=595692 RepID=A0A840V161_9BACT|nr:hypothetical protein [Haloferula luteola]MBB5351113.1 hypothetical protein [Haloferula luteola]
MPRAGVRALSQLLDAGEEVGTVLRACMARGESMGGARCRSTFFGHRSEADALACWSWVASDPDSTLILLAREPSDRYEVSLDFTHPTWKDEYGAAPGFCSGSVLRRVREMRKWMIDFATSHRCILLWTSDLEDYDKLSEKLGALTPDRAAWEAVDAARPGKRRWASPVRPEEESTIDWGADPLEGVDLSNNDWPDPFSTTEQIMALHRPKAPRRFIEAIPEHPRAIVYPWLAKSARWDELRYSLRSIKRHFIDSECPIYIIGDAPPPWFKPGGRVRWKPAQRYVARRSAGYWEAQLMGWQIADEVLWMNDDIYLLKDLGWDDFRVALHEGRLDHKLDEHYHSPNAWQRAMGRATADLMMLRPGMPVWRFATHTPFLLERRKVLEVLRRFSLGHKGSFANLYFNYHRTPRRKCGPLKTRSLPAAKSHRFLNHGHGGPTETTAALLAWRFADPAPWERPDEPAVVITSIGGEMPHLDEFLKHNPDAEWYEDAAPRAKGVELTRRWRSGDQRILDWWARNRTIVQKDRVAFIEADVRITTTLAQAFPAGGHFGCADVVRAGSAWPWFREIESLPEDLRPFACGVNPMSVVVFSREALDALLDVADQARGVFCELRLATLAASVGYPPTVLGSLANVHATRHLTVESGVTHPCKALAAVPQP